MIKKYSNNYGNPMEETDSKNILSIAFFNSICRICLNDVKDSEIININDYLRRTQEITIGESLMISEILSRCTSIEVSTR